MQLLLNISESEKERDKGIQRAKDKADFDNKDWSVRCWELFVRWLSKKEPGFEFKIEQFRTDCEKWGKIESPHSLRAYGFVSRRAEKERLISGAGTAKSHNPKAHATPVNVWIKL